MSSGESKAESVVLWIVVVAAGLAGCGGPEQAPRNYDPHVPLPAPQAGRAEFQGSFGAGTRLRPRVLQLGGAQWLLGWRDTELQMDCRFALASDGLFRCMPEEDTGFWDPRGQEGDCGPLRILPASVPSGGYFRERSGTDCDGKPVYAGGQAVSAYEEPVQTSPETTALECAQPESGANPTEVVFRPSQPDEFVRADLIVSEGDGRLGVVALVSEDNAWQLAGGYDRLFEGRCEGGFTGWVGDGSRETFCLPSSVGLADRATTGTGCRGEPALLVTDWPEDCSEAQPNWVVDDDPDQVSAAVYYEGTLSASGWDLEGEGCGKRTGQRALKAGDPHGEGLVALREEQLGTGRFRIRAWGLGGGEPAVLHGTLEYPPWVESTGSELIDTAVSSDDFGYKPRLGGAWCSLRPTRPGGYVCVTSTPGDFALYLDASCTQVAAPGDAVEGEEMVLASYRPSGWDPLALLEGAYRVGALLDAAEVYEIGDEGCRPVADSRPVRAAEPAVDHTLLPVTL